MGDKTVMRQQARNKRKLHIRKKLSGSTERPRLSVFRSDKHCYAQIIDDSTGRTLVSASTLGPEFAGHEGYTGNAAAAEKVGEILAAKAKEAGIVRVAFDRNGFLYHGRVKALAEGARKGGLEF